MLRYRGRMNKLGVRGVVGTGRTAVVLAALVAAMAFAALVLVSACGTQAGQGGRVAKAGDRVSVHYTGTLDDGKQFDSSKGRAPLQFTVGAGDVIAGFDRAVTGLDVGKSVKVRMEPKEAYGERREDLVATVPIAQVPQGLKVGQTVSLGGRRTVVKAITPEAVTVDANHELAGQALTFEIELVSIDTKP